jgi:hypothetical protein
VASPAGFENSRESTIDRGNGSIVQVDSAPIGAGSDAKYADPGGRTKPGDETIDSIDLTREVPPEWLRAAVSIVDSIDKLLACGRVELARLALDALRGMLEGARAHRDDVVRRTA